MAKLGIWVLIFIGSMNLPAQELNSLQRFEKSKISMVNQEYSQAVTIYENLRGKDPDHKETGFHRSSNKEAANELKKLKSIGFNNAITLNFNTFSKQQLAYKRKNK
jgi:hypothetical protein